MSMSGQKLGDHRFLLFKFVHRGVDFCAAECVDGETWNDVQFLAVASNWKGGDEALLHAVTAVGANASAVPVAGDWHSACVCSDGSYGVEQGLISSFPIRSDGKKLDIVPGLPINAFSRAKIDASVNELKEEKAMVAELLP